MAISAGCGFSLKASGDEKAYNAWRMRLILVLGLFSLPLAARDCEALKGLALPDIRITEAVPMPAEKPPAGSALPAGVPARGSLATVPYCKVVGVVGDEINFELLLPEDWNGKFLQSGGGGFVGSIGRSGQFSVNRGYATVGTDTGHQASGIRAGWAQGHPERLVNYGYLAVHRTAATAKAIIRAYYGDPAKYSYFYGCSNGGRQALMEAQRYPEDFDGIVAGAPAHDFTGVLAGFLYNMQRIFPDPADVENPVITPENRKLLQSTILERCDKIDGLEDGILDDPRECGFKVEDLPLCAGDAAAHCVTVQQREAIRAVYEGPRNQDGQIYPGFPLGGEAEGGAWQGWITGPSPSLMRSFHEPSSQYGFSTQSFKHLVFDDPEWDYRGYDFSTFDRDSRQLRAVADATDPGLDGLKKAGGKLILWHGWTDAALTAYGSINYFEEAEKTDPNIRDHFRLFMMPGVFHCAGGPGPDRVDWVTAIEDWVENGQAPEEPTAFRVADGKVDMARPLCVYPEKAVYTGSGKGTERDEFECRAP